MPAEHSGSPPPPQPPAAATGTSALDAEDRELAARLRRGDPQALEALYARYAGITLALLLRIVGSRAEAEDLLQEVFLQAWRRAPEYDPQRGSFSGWFFTIARNRALDVVRSPRHKLSVSEEPPKPPDAAVAPSATPEDSASLRQRAEAVKQALAELSQAQREAIELAYYGGLSHTEIAARTGEPLGTIKSRISHAAARLRAVLQQHGG